MRKPYIPLLTIGLLLIHRDVIAFVIDDLLGFGVGHRHGISAASVGDIARLGYFDGGGAEADREVRIFQ